MASLPGPTINGMQVIERQQVQQSPERSLEDNLSEQLSRLSLEGSPPDHDVATSPKTRKTFKKSKTSKKPKRSKKPRRLKDFHLFPKLPVEIQDMIWKIAVKNIRARTSCIQPDHSNHPGLLQACHESRVETLKKYDVCISRQDRVPFFFRIFIDYSKDMLYLNRNFTDLKVPHTVWNHELLYGSPLQSTITIYKDFLKPVQALAINLSDVAPMFQPAVYPHQIGLHPGAKHSGLWTLLGQFLRLTRLAFVVNGPLEAGKKVKQMFKDDSTYRDSPDDWVLKEKITTDLKKAKEEGVCVHLTIKYMKVEAEE